jgi:hypothetical protein
MNPQGKVGIRFECGSEDRFSREYGPFEWVQQTYQYLRTSDNNGEHIAEFDMVNSEWVVYAENPNCLNIGQHGLWRTHSLKPKTEDRVWYSDFVVFPWREGDDRG